MGKKSKAGGEKSYGLVSQGNWRKSLQQIKYDGRSEHLKKKRKYTLTRPSAENNYP